MTASSLKLRPTARLGLALALSALSTLQTVEAQYVYRRPRRRGGWRNIYLVAILVPIFVICLCLVFYFCLFKALCGRRRNRGATVLPSHQPQSGYPNYNQGSESVAAGRSDNYYNQQSDSSYSYGQQNGMTQYPQQAHVSSGQNGYNSYEKSQQEYAPPPGPPPQQSYQPPAGPPPKQ